MARSKFPKPIDHALIIEEYRSGASISFIAKKLSVKASRISSCLREHGVRIRTVSETLAGNTHARRHHLDRDEVIRLYWDEGKPLSEISRITGCKDIWNRVTGMGIPLRGTGDHLIGKPRRMTAEAEERLLASVTGSNSRHWRGGITPETAKFYRTQTWRNLRNAVLERDGCRCQLCGEAFAKSRLRAHHLKPRRYGGPDHPANLITLCNPCHRVYHLIIDDFRERGRLGY